MREAAAKVTSPASRYEATRGRQIKVCLSSECSEERCKVSPEVSLLAWWLISGLEPRSCLLPASLELRIYLEENALVGLALKASDHPSPHVISL